MLFSPFLAPASGWLNIVTGNSFKPAVGLPLVALLAVMAACTVPANASERRFTFVHEASTMPKGDWEYEQHVTWKTSKGKDSSFNRIEFRHEIEYGLTDDLQIALYLADWRYQGGRSVKQDRVEFRDSAIELKYNLTDPTTDWLGTALYGEFKMGDELIELEGKIIIQKNLGPVVLAYNATLEAEWEGPRYDDDKGLFEQTLGASYQFTPRYLAGVELLHEIEFDDWEETGDSAVYAGPNFSYRAKGWWVTVTQLFQLTDVDGEVDFQTRLLFGADF